MLIPSYRGLYLTALHGHLVLICDVLFGHLALRVTGCLRAPLRSVAVRDGYRPLRPLVQESQRLRRIAFVALTLRLRYTTLKQRGCVPGRRREALSLEQIQERMDQVMSRWQTYPDFAALLDALMDANGLSDYELAQQLTDQTATPLTHTTVRQYRCGEREPSYSFITGLLTTNALRLDPQRIQSADGDRPTGDQRLALFAAAGLIEVTPESIQEWNRDVLAGHRRLLATSPASPPRWGDLMTKLISFHMQGGRTSYHEIAASRTLTGGSLLSHPHRLSLLVSNRRPPSESERLALSRFAGLNDHQVVYIEDAIASGAIPLGPPRRQTPLAVALNSILDKLRAQEINQTQLVLQCAQCQAPGMVSVQTSDLPTWRHGHNKITLEKLRSLTAGLNQIGSRLRDPVTPGEISNLIASAGFAPHDLTDTTHQVVDRIDDRTQIKPLLAALRRAVDLSLPSSSEELRCHAAVLGITLPLAFSANLYWEDTTRTSSPTGQQVRDLLLCYNHFISRNGFPPLSDEEIIKIIHVAERDHTRLQQLSHAEKLAERKPHIRRQTPSPSL